MNSEQRRYFRHPVNLAVDLTVRGAEQQARMTDLGEGGMAVRVVKPVVQSLAVDFSFELSLGQPISGRGAIAWTDKERRVGIKFQLLRDQGQEHLQKWISDRQQISSKPRVSGD